jgi:eukaryotic-like serine/threonine-protein kinase
MVLPEATADPFVGLTIGSELQPEVKLRIERRLGEGGTAAAYFATRFGPDGVSPVVVKVILPTIIAQAGETARMVVRKEAVALGRLNERVPPSPFVVRLLDIGELEYRARGAQMTLPWLAIEYVHGGADGATLDERVKRSVRESGCAFTAERALRVLRHMADGLREIHDVGVIHRDINPNNVLCCGSGASEIFKISDFGIARPIGMEGTFGNAAVGTPGYISPEQASESEGPVGFPSDIFSAAAVMFFVLTGEPYFETKSFWQVILDAKNPARRSILDVAALAPEIREDQETCRAIDQALAQATSADSARRPTSAKTFAASLLPWLTSCPPTKRAIPVPGTGRASLMPPSISSWQFSTRHPVGHDWILTDVGWDGDGHCLGATTHGLVYFDGTRWSDVPAQSLPGLSGVKFCASVGAGRWLIGGGAGAVAEYSRSGVTRVLAGQKRSLELDGASGDLEDLAAYVGRDEAGATLAASASGRWLKAIAVTDAAALLDITRVTELEWLVVGRSREGRARAWLYRPLMWDASLVGEAPARAFTACAGLPERELGLAVGTDGAVLRLDHGRLEVSQLQGAPNLSSVAMDVLGRAWAGAAGALWFSPDAGVSWQLAWRDERWAAPFVSIFADVGMVFAATADGAVLEARSGLSQMV